MLNKYHLFWINCRNLLKFLFYISCILLISFILLELILFFLYQNHSITRNIAPINNFLRKFYSSQRSIIQFNPDCAKYSDNLTYVLKEGECVFKNKEFNTKYSINHLGLRDDDDSLNQPEIIILGDSYAMGWGVEQDKNFASLIEKKSGLKTLNAGISSYGTAREYILFNKLDITNLKYLIIQYCSNDFTENKAFINNDFKLNVTSEEEYQNWVAKHLKKAGKYKPFRFSTILIRDTIRNVKNKNKIIESTINSEKEFEFLQEILENFRKITNDKVKIIVFELDQSDKLDSNLYKFFKDNKINNLEIFDSKKILSKEDYFILDDHINNSGHKKISDKILTFIKNE